MSQKNQRHTLIIALVCSAQSSISVSVLPLPAEKVIYSMPRYVSEEEHQQKQWEEGFKSKKLSAPIVIMILYKNEKKNPTFIRPQDIKWHRNQIALLDSSPNGFFFFSCINYDNYKATKLFILGVMLHKCRTHSFSQLHSRLWSQLIIFCVYSCFIVRKNTGRLWAIDQLVMRFWLAAFSIIRPSTVASVCTGGGGQRQTTGSHL